MWAKYMPKALLQLCALTTMKDGTAGKGTQLSTYRRFVISNEDSCLTCDRIRAQTSWWLKCLWLNTRALLRYPLAREAGYTLTKFMKIPFQMPRNQRKYNYLHSKMRNVIEDAFQTVKERFQLLDKPFNDKLDKGNADRKNIRRRYTASRKRVRSWPSQIRISKCFHQITFQSCILWTLEIANQIRIIEKKFI